MAPRYAITTSFADRAVSRYAIAPSAASPSTETVADVPWVLALLTCAGGLAEGRHSPLSSEF